MVDSARFSGALKSLPIFLDALADLDTPSVWRSPEVRGEFLAEVRARMRRGQAVFDDERFTWPARRLIAALRVGGQDLAGWGYILWVVAGTLPGSVARARLRELSQQAAVLGELVAQLMAEAGAVADYYADPGEDAPPL